MGLPGGSPGAARGGGRTRMQALSASLFLYREVPGKGIGDVRAMVRARSPVRLPVVLSREEVGRVLAGLTGDVRIAAILLYGAGLRLLECLTLRVKDVDFDRGEIRVRRGKGGHDRVTILPVVSRGPMTSIL